MIPLAMGLVGRDGAALPLRLEDEPEHATATSRVLVLDDDRSFFTFVDVEQPPVLSLLRGFSAPVVVVDGLSDADLIVLLRHDSDPFNRWEAGQRIALHRLLAAVRSGEPATLDADFFEAMREVLRHPALDPAFKELVLTLPSESYVAEQLDVVDPQKIHAAREAMKSSLARELRADWEWAFDAHQVTGGYSPDPIPAGRRALANLSLGMLCLDSVARGDAVWPGRAYQRFKDASNMTERQGALMALLFSGSSLAEAALDRFLDMFRQEPLVVDKWFTLQATAPDHGGDAFARVQKLLRHPEFNIANPNRARSLIGAFCVGNPAAFHRGDGAGYEFWADRVLEIDASTRSSHRASPARSTAGRSSPSPIERRRGRRSRASLPRPEALERHGRDRRPRALGRLRLDHGSDEREEERVLRAVGRRHGRHQRVRLRRDRDGARPPRP